MTVKRSKVDKVFVILAALVSVAFLYMVVVPIFRGPWHSVWPAKSLSFRVVIPPGFEGTLRLHENPRLPLDYSKTYILRARNGVAEVPMGFLTDGPQQPVYYDIVDLEDDSGRILSRGEDPPIGEVGVRGMFSESVPPSNKEQAWYFVIKGKPSPNR